MISLSLISFQEDDGSKILLGLLFSCLINYYIIIILSVHQLNPTIIVTNLS